MAERLTERQLQCLRLSATMTDKEIARALGISENTVDKHFREVFRRLGVTTRKAALRALARDASYAPLAISGDGETTAGERVDAAGLAGPSHPAVRADRGLYGLYVRLGRWRTPGTVRVRALAILGWAVAGVIVLALLTGMVALIFGGLDPIAPTGPST